MEGQTGEFREMVRELARRDVDGALDAGAGGLNADKRYGFQDNLLERMQMRKPPTAAAGGGLDAEVLKGQAMIPARVM